MKSFQANISTNQRKYFSFFIPTAVIAGAAGLFWLAVPQPKIIDTDKTKTLAPTAVRNNAPLKSVRIDLSSMAMSSDRADSIRQIISQLSRVSANAVYINPWSDGYANYQSRVAPLNQLGRQEWLEEFINQAHTANLQVLAWFVVGKDNFPADQHPEWYARTISGQPYRQEDEPGVNLPFASLANRDYIDYHLALIDEINQLPIDGWVISEPLIGWGDKYDKYYTDFSSAALSYYQQQEVVQPIQIIRRAREDDSAGNQDSYNKLISARANIVTDFVRQTIQKIRQSKTRPIIITVYTEPDDQGTLKSFNDIKEWLGADIEQLAQLSPDIIEIQSLFLDFEHPQPPDWTASMVRQFRKQLAKNIPIAVSVQGFDSAQPLTPADFASAFTSVLSESTAGTSFYAYHTLKPEHWELLARLWQ